MSWKLSLEDQNLKVHADILLAIFKNTEDLNIHLPLEELNVDHRLKDDLGMDSVQIVSVLYELEEKYPHLSEEHLKNWAKIRDVLESMRDQE